MTKPFRFLFKLAVRLRYGRAGSHAYMWLPYLRLTRPGAGKRGEIIYKGSVVGTLSRSDVLADAAKHDVVYVIGSGPSIGTNDLSLIPDGAAILLNGAISLVGNGLGRPLAVAIEDERFVYRHFDMIRTRVDREVICLFSVTVLRAIAEMDPAWLKDRTVVLIDNIRKPYDAPRPDLSEFSANAAFVVADGGRVGFSLEPDQGVFQGGSVVVSAMQFALFCRPGMIGLLGVDISNANEPRFYEDRKDMAKSGVVRATDRIIAHLSLARRVALSRGTAVSNYSAVSALRGAGFGYDPRLTRLQDSQSV